MTISTKGLQHLGFLPDIDFVLQDNGAGVEIRDWNSSSPIPNEADIEAAKAVWDEEQSARPARLASAKAKLEDMGLTTEEVKEAFGI